MLEGIVVPWLECTEIASRSPQDASARSKKKDGENRTDPRVGQIHRDWQEHQQSDSDKKDPHNKLHQSHKFRRRMTCHDSIPSNDSVEWPAQAFQARVELHLLK